MPKTTYTYDFIKKYMKDDGYTLLTEEKDYKNCSSPLTIECPRHHILKTTAAEFCNRNRRCKKCQRIGIDRVREEFDAIGYTLLSTEYKNNRTKLDYICDKGHKHVTTYQVFQQGSRCPDCVRTPFDEIKKAFEDEGYTILSLEEEYTSNKYKFKFRCKNGHISSMTWNNFKRGHRCGKCAPNRKKTIEEVKDLFIKKNYTLLSTEYVDEHDSLEFICPNGHRYKMTWSNFKKGQNCAKCSAIDSKAEKEIFDFFRDKVDNIIPNDRIQIKPYELDMYFPEYKLAIEYCGLYWHSEITGRKENKYHRMKYDLCKEKGIRLITIFEDEYLNRPQVVLSRISQALGLNEKVYARKLVCKEISNREANEFYDKYHLQGRTRCTISWGLFKGEKLLSCLSLGPFSRPHTGSKSMLELKRMASLPFISVVGGFGKLFSAAKNFSLDEGYSQIKSYCDMRYASLITVYDKLGFNLISETKYTPHYIKGGIRYRNQSLVKTKEERKLGFTEKELRIIQGFDLIWDCGHRTYKYKLSKE